MYTLMEQELSKRISSEETPEMIRTAASAGLVKLQQYHELAKKCQYNWLATGDSLALSRGSHLTLFTSFTSRPPKLGQGARHGRAL